MKKAALFVACVLAIVYIFLHQETDATANVPVNDLYIQAFMSGTQSLGSDLLDCRIAKAEVVCGKSGQKSFECSIARRRIMNDGIFDVIKHRKLSPNSRSLNDVELNEIIDTELTRCKE